MQDQFEQDHYTGKMTRVDPVYVLQKRLHKQLCAEVRLIEKGNNLLMVETPFTFSDGDPYQIYLKELPTGNLRMSDYGHTFMHLSYENEIDKFRDGTRGKVLQSILSEMDIQEDDGELFVDFPLDKLGAHILRFGQAIAMVCVLAERGAD